MCNVFFIFFSEHIYAKNHETLNANLKSIVALIRAFSALTLLVGRQEGHPACKKTEWWGAGVVICLEWGTDLHTPGWCHCYSHYSLSLAPVKSRLVLPFWYRLTRVVPDKEPLNGCVCVALIIIKCFSVSAYSNSIVNCKASGPAPCNYYVS